MSLNLGTKALEAMKRLAANPEWQAIRASILNSAQEKMNAALDSPADRLDNNTGYARALRDLHLFCESATTGTPINSVAKPGLVKS
jgi:hypothetical protein